MEPEPAPAVPAQETVEEPPTQEPTDGPVTPPSDRDRNGTDPEEFEEDLGDPGAGGEQGTSGPSPTSIPAAARLPQTGTNVAPPAAAGLLLLLAGMSLRRVRPARR